MQSCSHSLHTRDPTHSVCLLPHYLTHCLTHPLTHLQSMSIIHSLPHCPTASPTHRLTVSFLLCQQVVPSADTALFEGTFFQYEVFPETSKKMKKHEARKKREKAMAKQPSGWEKQSKEGVR